MTWDPRGVGSLTRSVYSCTCFTPPAPLNRGTSPGEVYCFDSTEQYNQLFNGTIEFTGIEETGNFTDPADIKALLSQAPAMQNKYRQVEQMCLNGPSGKSLQYLGTAAAVRDMVAMADALDGPDAPINYIGISYGTLIGAWFVNSESPHHVGIIGVDV